MTDELKKAIHQWIDIEHRFSLERRPDRAIDRTRVFEMSPLKEKKDLDFFLHIRMGDYSFCATMGSDNTFHGFWNTIPDESHIHYNHYYELLYVVDGSFQYDMLQQNALLHTGEAMIIDTHCIYWDKKIDSDSIVLCFAISIPFFTRLANSLEPTSPLRYLLESQIDASMKEQRYLRFFTEAGSAADLHQQHIMASFLEERRATDLDYPDILAVLMKRLLLSLLDVPCQTCRINNGRKDSELLLQLEQYVHSHLANISRELLAEQFHYNQLYFNRLLKKCYGLTLNQYIRQARLDQAKQLLLTTDLPVYQIIGLVGYQNQNYFNRIFLKDTGMTPHQFRKGSPLYPANIQPPI